MSDALFAAIEDTRMRGHKGTAAQELKRAEALPPRFSGDLALEAELKPDIHRWQSQCAGRLRCRDPITSLLRPFQDELCVSPGKPPRRADCSERKTQARSRSTCRRLSSGLGTARGGRCTAAVGHGSADVEHRALPAQLLAITGAPDLDSVVYKWSTCMILSAIVADAPSQMCPVSSNGSQMVLLVQPPVTQSRQQIPCQLYPICESQLLEKGCMTLCTTLLQVVRLGALTMLQCQSNSLQSVPAQLSQLTALAHLDLSCNKISKIDEAVDHLHTLCHLDLSDNAMSDMASNIGKLTRLTCLHLHSNALVTVPDTLGQLVKLKKLSLHTNVLESVPASLGCLAKLEWLTLNNNKLTSVPPELFKCAARIIDSWQKSEGSICLLLSVD